MIPEDLPKIYTHDTRRLEFLWQYDCHVSWGNDKEVCCVEQWVDERTEDARWERVSGLHHDPRAAIDEAMAKLKVVR